MASRKQAFLVRLWSATSGSGDGAEGVSVAPPPGTRGSVEHLESKRRLYFSEMAQLVEFLTSTTNESGPG